MKTEKTSYGGTVQSKEVKDREINYPRRIEIVNGLFTQPFERLRLRGVNGSLTFEEGTWAAWLYDLLKPHVTKLVVCDPRNNKSMREGNQSDKIDARRLAELLRCASMPNI